MLARAALVCAIAGTLSAQEAARDVARKAATLEASGDYAKALALLDDLVRRYPGEPDLLNRRGSVRFKAAQIDESIADFDEAIRRAPQIAPHHWQRGISLYYAGKFEECRKQFESHRTVNAEDVENAVWHYLCLAREKDIAKAREQLIPIREDTRIPMMEVHALFAGKSTPEAVMNKARSGSPPPDELNMRLFYAHLYLGLWEEARRNRAAALSHIRQAAEQHKVDHYMWDVARVHLQLAGK